MLDEEHTAAVGGDAYEAGSWHRGRVYILLEAGTLPALENCSLIQVIPSSCHALSASLSKFGSLDFISSVKKQMP